jgi:hypothetical protein
MDTKKSNHSARFFNSVSSKIVQGNKCLGAFSSNEEKKAVPQ